MAVYNQTVLTPDPLYLQPKSYDARADRKWFSDIASPGVLSPIDYAVTVPGSPVGLTLNVAAGVAWILGGNIADQGLYRQYIAAATTVIAPAAHASLPRIDTVILRIMDTAADASGFSEPRIEVVPGTATSGATLANLNGKNPLTALGEASKSFIVLAYVLVPGAATVFTNTATNVLDGRTRARLGSGGLGIKTTIGDIAFGPPASPNDGDIWVAVLYSAGLATGVRWSFQYNALSTSTYKWENMSGVPQITFPTGGTLVNDTAAHQFYANPPLRNGDWLYKISGRFNPVSGAGGINYGWSINGAGAVRSGNNTFTAAAQAQSLYWPDTVLNILTSQNMTFNYASNVPGLTLDFPMIEVLPIRIS